MVCPTDAQLYVAKLGLHHRQLTLEGLSGFYTPATLPSTPSVWVPLGTGMHRGRWLVSQLHCGSLGHSHLPEQPGPALSAFKCLPLLQATLTLATNNG